MPKVRRALEELRRLDLELFEEDHPVLSVTLAGEIVFDAGAIPLQGAEGQYLERQLLDLVGPFKGLEGTQGPDLLRPRPTLRILPRKISGAPHIEGTRLPTESISALKDRGLSVEQIARIYPFASRESLQESLDLEEQLKRNVSLTRVA